MIIIFGCSTKAVLKDDGRFFCPQCYHRTDYQYYKVSRYFTLFFIPIFPYSHITDFIKCQECKGEFETEVLNIHRDRIIAEIDKNL